MKRIVPLGILAFLIVTIGSASAAVVHYDITTDNIGQPISITVTYDTSTRILTYTDNNFISGTQGILDVAYNTGVSSGTQAVNVVTNPTANNWYFGGGNQGFNGYGQFDSQYGSSANNVYNTVTLTLPQGTTLVQNDKGSTVAVHYKWNIAQPNTGMGGDGGESTNVPEFPSMVLPVAAILGIMIIFGRRNKQ